MYICMFNVPLLHVVHYRVDVYVVGTNLFYTGTLVYGYVFLVQKWDVPEI
jgi:hypothetical protein